jgi:hypothetical protein
MCEHQQQRQDSAHESGQTLLGLVYGCNRCVQQQCGGHVRGGLHEV